MSDVNICVCQLPCGVKGFCKKNDDDSYTIVLNAALDREAQRKTFLHELRHLLHNDFEGVSSVSEKELALAFGI